MLRIKLYSTSFKILVYTIIIDVQGSKFETIMYKYTDITYVF